jgi:hypothetical protein
MNCVTSYSTCTPPHRAPIERVITDSGILTPGSLLLIVWWHDFVHVTHFMNGLPALIRNRIESKIYWLTTDVAEYCLLIHGLSPFQSTMVGSGAAVHLRTRPDKPERDVAWNNIEHVACRSARGQPIE